MSELSEFEKQIEKAEKALDAKQLAIEAAKEKIITSGRVKKLKNKPLKDLSFAELDTMKDDGIFPNDFPQAEGSFPDTSGLYSKLLTNLKQILEIRGHQVSLKPMKSLIDVRDNIFAVRDAMKQNTEPSLGGLEIPIGGTIEYDENEFKSYGENFAKSDEPHIIQKNVDCTKMAPGEYCEVLDDGTWRVRKSKSYQEPEITKKELIQAKQVIESVLGYTKEELIQTKYEIESMLRSYT